jgi:hypothetical protein
LRDRTVLMMMTFSCWPCGSHRQTRDRSKQFRQCCGKGARAT